MAQPPVANRFPISLYATPNPSHQEVFYTVPRAGHLLAGTEHHIKRDHFPGHELILCLRGKGWTRIAGRTHQVRRGDLVWINCHHPHEHGAVADDPWEVYWIRAEGPRLAQLSDLLAVRDAPVIGGMDLRAASPVFKELFRLIPADSPESPALIHAQVAELVAQAYCARQRLGDLTPKVPPALARCVEQMKLFYFEKHTVPSLARLAGLSPTHFSRVFKSSFGTSPIDWLRRERISQAKRRLADTADDIKEIAEQVGYSDRYFFSKDFKKHTGFTPTQFRVRETDRLRAE
jgi:AraC-like DNA-binding protein